MPDERAERRLAAIARRKKKVPPTVARVTQDIKAAAPSVTATRAAIAGATTAGGLPVSDLGGLAQTLGIGENDLALVVNQSVGTKVWNGMNTDDRLLHTTAMAARDLVTTVERSLVAQENYLDFEARLFKQLGVADKTTPLGILKDIATEVDAEVKIAWNEAMVAMNATADTALVWRSVLGDTTTPGCAARHGKLIDELGEMPPRHWRCRCDVTTIANPESDNPDTAASGKTTLGVMEEERAGWGASDAELMEESAHRYITHSAHRPRAFREGKSTWQNEYTTTSRQLT